MVAEYHLHRPFVACMHDLEQALRAAGWDCLLRMPLPHAPGCVVFARFPCPVHRPGTLGCLCRIEARECRDGGALLRIGDVGCAALLTESPLRGCSALPGWDSVLQVLEHLQASDAA